MMSVANPATLIVASSLAGCAALAATIRPVRASTRETVEGQVVSA